MEADVIIIGAGAAGLMCAIEAGKRGKRVAVLEHSDRIAKKVLISGGGRCNFTNRDTKPDAYLSRNPHFAKSALARFTPADFLALIERHRIPYFEKKLGQLFCQSSSKHIVAMLEAECRGAGVQMYTRCAVTAVKKEAHFTLDTTQGLFTAPALVIATGGLSYTSLGASDFGYRIARQFGLPIVPPSPALVPLTWRSEDSSYFHSLSGISVDAEIRCGKRAFRENVLFTHRGLSGPAILQISSYWAPGETIRIDLLPDIKGSDWLIQNKRDHPKAALSTILGYALPKRFVDAWCGRYVASEPMQGYTDKTLTEIARTLHHWLLVPAGTEGYPKAEVTCGGVDTNELSSKTMECKKIPGLYFIGEVVDVTGHLGGYNFQWAWASGAAAGRAV